MAYHFRVTVTLILTSDLVFSIIVSGAYLQYSLRKESQIWCVEASCNDKVSRTIIWVTLTLNLTSDLVFRNCIESGAYILYSLS